MTEQIEIDVMSIQNVAEIKMELAKYKLHSRSFNDSYFAGLEVTFISRTQTYFPSLF